MLHVYMVGKIVLLGVSFDIVYNEFELVHENTNETKTILVLQSSEKISILLKERWRCVK